MDMHSQKYFLFTIQLFIILWQFIGQCAPLVNVSERDFEIYIRNDFNIFISSVISLIFCPKKCRNKMAEKW